MANIALYIDGAVLGLPCRAKAQLIDGAAGYYGTIALNKDSMQKVLKALEMDSDIADALCAALDLPDTVLEFKSSNKLTAFAVRTDVLVFAALKAQRTAVLLSLDTKKLKSSGLALFKAAAAAAEFLCIQSLYFQYGQVGELKKYSSALGTNLPIALPQCFANSDMLIYGSFDFNNGGAFGSGMKALLGIDKMDFAAANSKSGFIAGAFLDKLELGDVKISSIFLAVANGGFKISGQLSVQKFSFVLDCSASLSEFSLAGYMPQGTEIALGNDWRITELAIAIGYSRGLTITMLGRIMARKLMLFAAISAAIAPSGFQLRLLSAATSDLSLPNIVYSFTTAEISGLDSFDFIRIEGFALPCAQHLSESERRGTSSELAAGFNRVMQPCGLALYGSYKLSAFGDDIILTDEGRMRNYTIAKSGEIRLNPQFYFATMDLAAFAGYEIKKGAFFCGTISIFGFTAKVFFQTDSDGIMAYLNIAPIRAGIFELTQSSMKSSPNVPKPSPGGMVSQFLDPNTQGAELFICMAKSQRCFYLDARLKIWNILCFDAHVVYADEQVSVDARLNFLGIFDVSFYLRANYSDFNSLNFEFALIADTGGLKRLVEKAINNIENAAREMNTRMDSAARQIQSARNSVNGLWNTIADFNGRIDNCRRRISNAPWYKRWYIAIGAGFEICGYEIAKAGVYIAIGVAQAALAIAEGLVRMAQAIGNVALIAVKGFLQGVISLFYIERLALAGSASKNGAALGVKLDFVALGKSYSAQGTLEIGEGAGARCGDLLNGMVEQNTASDVKALNSLARSSKKTYRAAAIDEQKALYAEAGEYCKLTRSYMRDLGARYTREYGAIMPSLEEVSLGVDSAIKEASQGANLILSLTDNMNFATAFDEVQKGIDSQPQSKASRARGHSLEELRAQYQEVERLKNEVRGQSQSINTNTKQGVFEATQEKVKAVVNARAVRSAHDLYNVNPDKILDAAENMMYTKFKQSRSRAYFCPYNEPAILNALDECRTNKSAVSMARLRKRSEYRNTDYKTRL